MRGGTGDARHAVGALQGLAETTVHEDPSLLAIYAQDQARLPAAFRGLVRDPLAVVQPHTPAATAAVLAACRDLGVSAVPRGAGSNAFGGSLALGPAVVVDTRRLDRIHDVAAGQAWVEAGATWRHAQAVLEPQGWLPCVHTTSHTSTVGGMVATGGYGLGSTGHGHIADNVAGLEVATPDGLRKLSVEEASHLFRTDGQFGIITAACLRLRPRPTHTATVVQHASDYGTAIGKARKLARLPGIQTVLVYSRSRVHELNRVLGRPLVPERDTVVARLEADAPLEVPPSDVERHIAGLLWQQRHFPMRPLKLGPGLLGAETILPDARVGRFAAWAERAVSAFGLDAAHEAYVLPDGHVLQITTFLTDAEAPSYTAHVAQVARMTRKAVALGGVPYGGGLWNLPFARHRHPDLAALRSRKRREDPTSVLNPGKSLAPPPRTSRAGAMLRTPAATVGPSLLRAAAPWMRYRPRSLRPDRPDVAHPGTNAADRTHVAGVQAQEEGKGADTGQAFQVVDAHAYSRAACTQCAACVDVCPAWMHTGDERTTARGKLHFMARFAHDPDSVTADEAATLYQCIRCRACEEVCQTDLPLLAAFDGLEATLTARFGFPRDRVLSFLQGVEADPRAQALIDETRGVFQQPHALYRDPPEAPPRTGAEASPQQTTLADGEGPGVEAAAAPQARVRGGA